MAMSINLKDIALAALSVLLCLYLVSRAQAFLAVYRKIRNTPGGVHILYAHPQSLLTPILPNFPGWDVGHLRAKGKPYVRKGQTIIASTPITSPRPMFWIADPAAIQRIGASRQIFPKQTEIYGVIAFYGPNIVSTEGAEWKRHHDVSKLAFGEANNRVVWKESMRCVKEWFDVLDSTPGDVLVDAHDVMTRLSLLVISAAGFGRTVSYTADAASVPPPGFTLPFRPALITAVSLFTIQALSTMFPVVAYVPGLRGLVTRTKVAYDELRRHLAGMIEGTREEMKGVSLEDEEDSTQVQGVDGADLFRRLIRANEDDDKARAKLSDDELLSTTYIFLVAGHETTANTLAFAVALLALHPEAQDALRKEADEIWPFGLPTDPIKSYREDVPRLKYAEATVRETLRLFPSAARIPKLVAQDTVLRGTYLATGVKYDVAVPKDSLVWLDVWALHTMREYWGDDAEEFRPERFFDTDTYKWPRDAFAPFSLGARACIGARFAALEMMCILSHAVREYDILVPPELDRLDDAEKRKRLLAWRISLGTTAKGATVLLRKRR